MSLLQSLLTKGIPQLPSTAIGEWQIAINRELWTLKGLAQVIEFQKRLDAHNIHPDAPDARLQRKSLRNYMEVLQVVWQCALLRVPSTVAGLDMTINHPLVMWAMMVMYAEAGHVISQELFNFWACADMGELSFIEATNAPQNIEGIFEELEHNRFFEFESPEYIALTSAFRNQLVAETDGLTPVYGEFVMPHEPLPALDALIKWDELRLIVRPYGIWASFVADDKFFPFFWSPTVNTLNTMDSGKLVYVVDALMAGIWRDACVVKERAWHERTPRTSKPAKKSQRHRNPVTLPRTIYNVRWGASADERETIMRATHSVRPHYRHLGDTRHASADAVASADEYGMPRPPEGYTFVRPHLRGSRGGQSADMEEVEAVRRVVCRGLQTVKIALG